MGPSRGFGARLPQAVMILLVASISAFIATNVWAQRSEPSAQDVPRESLSDFTFSISAAYKLAFLGGLTSNPSSTLGDGKAVLGGPQLVLETNAFELREALLSTSGSDSITLVGPSQVPYTYEGLVSDTTLDWKYIHSYPDDQIYPYRFAGFLGMEYITPLSWTGTWNTVVGDKPSFVLARFGFDVGLYVPPHDDLTHELWSNNFYLHVSYYLGIGTVLANGSPIGAGTFSTGISIGIGYTLIGL